jgi:hypothetical protein
VYPPRSSRLQAGTIEDRDSAPVAEEPVMTFQAEIDAIKSRIAEAESERDIWRVAGQEEKYVVAHFMVEALELQLDDRLRAEAIARAPLFVDTEASWRLP